MRILCGTILAAIAAGTAVNAAEIEPFPAGARVAFYGDSITRNGGAVLRVAAHYKKAFPERNVRFFNCGISGGGLVAAEMYFGNVLAARKPTHVVLAFGVNDSIPFILDPNADKDAEAARIEAERVKFRERYAALVERIRNLGAKVILRTATPYNEFGEGTVPAVAGKDASYRRIADEIRAFAKERGLPLLDDYEKMKKCLADGEDVFAGDRVHPNDYGQWRMAETLLAAQGLRIEPYRPRGEVATSTGLAEWESVSQKIANLNSAEWLVVRDETLDVPAKMEKVKDWLATKGSAPGANQFVVGLANDYLRDKPHEADLLASLDQEYPELPRRISSETEEEKSARMAWWTEGRFGMFIHFGLYSVLARHEWVQNFEAIDPGEYEHRYMPRFNPDLYDAKAWAAAAKAAGMKYMVLTTKHHEGFCLWDTKTTDFKTTNTDFGRDVVREFVDACREAGLGVGFYFSLKDWHSKDFTLDQSHPLLVAMRKRGLSGEALRAEVEKANRGRDMDKFRAMMFAQVRELLTEYGKIDIIWYDYTVKNCEYPRSYKDWDAVNLVKLTRELQPGAIIDSRLDLMDTDDGWDFVTPEQFKVQSWPTVRGQRVPWETCQTFSGSWGYARDEETWKSVPQLIELLSHSVSMGGNLILNVGPTARGEFDWRAKERLKGIADWMHFNSRSIYGCGPAPEGFAAPNGTALTYSAKANRLYLHLYDYPMGFLPLAFLDKVEYAQFLHDGSEVKLVPTARHHAQSGEQIGALGGIKLPVKKPAIDVPVVEMWLK